LSDTKDGSVNIVSDVAGRFNEFLRLKEQMPDEPFLFVGDLNDRGKQSKEMIEWVMNDPNSKCLHSNHGAMFIDFYDGLKSYYHPEDFLRNGGFQTLVSYGYEPEMQGFSIDIRHAIKWCRENETMTKHVEWLRNLPWYHKEEGLFVSHAARHPMFPLEELCKDTYESYNYSLIWNRHEPDKIDGVFQVLGHNSPWGLTWFGPAGENWAVCLDDSRKDKLTAMHWPSLKIYQEDYDA